MTEILFALVIAFSFFAQSLMGFGGGLLSIPLLSLFMPVQDAVTIVILYQFSMGMLIFKTHKQTGWQHIRRLIPAMVVGVILGLVFLKYVPGDAVRLLLAAYIALHLLRTHTNIDPLKTIIERGGAWLSGLLGGVIQGTIGGGGPAFILYLKDKAKNSAEFRANVLAILFLSNIPRIAGSFAADFVTKDLILLGLIAYPGFLLSLFLGQKLHDKIPQKTFFNIAEAVLAFAAMSLIVKVIL